MSDDDKNGPAPVAAVRQLGEYIREQRRSSQISLRQLATLAGVSNPYLSQIERGLRKPSAEILQQIAKGLRVSAEAMYVQAGILEQRDASVVVDAVLADPALTERHKQVLIEIYESFRKEAREAAGDQPVATVPDSTPRTKPAPRTPRTASTTPDTTPDTASGGTA